MFETMALPQVFDWDERLFATLSNGGRQIEATRLNVRIVNGVGITEFRVDRDKSINPQDVVSYNLEVIPVTRLTIKVSRGYRRNMGRFPLVR